jgi:hypothetical protein
MQHFSDISHNIRHYIDKNAGIMEQLLNSLSRERASAATPTAEELSELHGEALLALQVVRAGESVRSAKYRCVLGVIAGTTHTHTRFTWCLHDAQIPSRSVALMLTPSMPRAYFSRPHLCGD